MVKVSSYSMCSSGMNRGGGGLVWCWWLARRSARIAVVRCWVRVWLRRGIIADLSPAGSVRGVVTGRGAQGGEDQGGEDQGTAGVGDVLLAGRAGPDDRAVTELFLAPTPERLDEVMKPTG